jgi:hypothetical protein
LHFWRGRAFSGIDAIALTAVMPTTGIAVALAGRCLAGPRAARALIPLAVCLGLWVSGPAAMLTCATATGGGFAMPDAWETLALFTALFPVVTFSMSTYDGSLFGVLITTGALVALGAAPALGLVDSRHAGLPVVPDPPPPG